MPELSSEANEKITENGKSSEMAWASESEIRERRRKEFAEQKAWEQELFDVCRRGSFYRFRELLQDHNLASKRININALDDGPKPGKFPSSSLGRGMTALMWACYYGHADIVEMLLRDFKANVEIKDAVYGRTALIWAAAFGYGRIVRLLLNVGHAKINERDKAGFTAFSLARGYNQYRTAELLKERGGAD